MSNPIEHDAFSLEDWSLVQHSIEPETVGLAESLFALSNGYVGVRGCFEQGEPVWQPTTVINGLYESWPILYEEPAFGYATTGQTIVRVPDATVIEVRVDGELLEVQGQAVVEFERRLDMRAGTVKTESSHRLADGAVVTLETMRIVSLSNRHLMATLVEVNGAAGRAVEVRSALVDRANSFQDHPYHDARDPRRTRLLGWHPLNPVGNLSEDGRLISSFVTERSRLALACGVDHVVAGATAEMKFDPDVRTVVIRAQGTGDSVRIAKFVAYHADLEGSGDDMAEDVAVTLNHAVQSGFDSLAVNQRSDLDDFWAEAAIDIDGDDELQKAARWALFQLHQASAGIKGLSVPAKGLSGDAYEGHYFWDSEMYFLPFLAFTNPDRARELLRFRMRMLPEARRRAGELALRGALFPWRTINGQAAGSYYPAGTAQYHINADISYAIRQYTAATGDDEFLWNGGAEVAIETARLWADLGFYDRGTFHIHLVTGPDEYTALVNDNAYTNLMARQNLQFAAHVVERMRRLVPDRYAELEKAIGLDTDEPTEWIRAAESMYVGYDEELGVTPQDSTFLSKEIWDFEGTPADKYPLLLHFHPLVIYRYQVLKQPDVVMAMLLVPGEFSEELKRANFDYYDLLTTGDSSLSSAVQATVAARIGYEAKALDYLRHTAFIDLADLQGNTRDGLHLASAGGVWMALVRGFGGLRVTDETLVLDPKLPEDWKSLRFSLAYRGSRLVVTTSSDGVTLEVFWKPLVVQIWGKSVPVAPDSPVFVPNGTIAPINTS
jgi:alpha,alpha-trehalose phosphorylase